MTSTTSVPDLGRSPTIEERARALFAERGQLIRATAADTFAVPSAGMLGQRYTVRYGGHVEESCTCPAYQYGHGRACKHLLAVGMLHAARRSGVREVRAVEVAGGDPFRCAGGARSRSRLRELADRYRHELLDDAARQEIRDEIQRL